MQPRLLALIITLLPFIVCNAVYLISAYEGNVPWCFVYIDGCTTISQAGRSGNAIFVFRASMIAHAVLLAWFWLYVKQWLDLLHGESRVGVDVLTWIGIIGALFLVLYIDFLGTDGDMNRFMRRIGVIIYFAFTALAQLLLLRQHKRLVVRLHEIVGPVADKILRYQMSILLLTLAVALSGLFLDVFDMKTTRSENVVEWNFSVLMTLYFAGMVWLWKGFAYQLTLRDRH